ncbi:MAG: 50S ribosomal protein L6 [Candidatus Gracilibacteria bacterium]
MSRIGKKIITIPSGCTVTVQDSVVHVKGSKGELSYEFPVAYVEVKLDGDVLTVTRKEVDDAPKFQGLARSILANMVQGVSKGFEKKLEIHGVGYKAQVQGAKLVLSLGYSHPVEVPAPTGVTFTMDPDEKNTIVITGFDKELVGQVASDIRELRSPEPYKGKGIRYKGEHIIRKAGKSAGK